MTFILTGKPSVAKAFAHALTVLFTGSYYGNSRYLITNCLGHLFQAFDPEDYEVHYKKWSLSDLPIIPHTIRFKKIEASKKNRSSRLCPPKSRLACRNQYFPSVIPPCKNTPFDRKSADSRTCRNIQTRKRNRRLYPNSLL